MCIRDRNRGGVGTKGSQTRDEDFVEYIYPATNHNYMLFFTQKGKCYWLRVYEIPEGTKTSKGRAIQNLLNIDSDDSLSLIHIYSSTKRRRSREQNISRRVHCIRTSSRAARRMRQ